LEKEGLIENLVDDTSIPLNSEYTLTPSGLDIIINIVLNSLLLCLCAPGSTVHFRFGQC
jgi:hypothetical protein